MKQLERNEVIGVAAGIGIVVVLFVGMRMFPGATMPVMNSESNATGDDIVDISKAQSPEAVTEALAGAIGADGGVSDLIIQDSLIGEGAEVVEGSVVTVHYVGLLQSGVQFDNSMARGEPFTFRVGAGDVIEGWDVGVVGMKKGGERILVIPPEMAYGARGVGSIPPNSTLLFAIQLLEVQ